MSSRFKNSGRKKEGGHLVTHKHDFEVHRKGEDWRHNADHVDMNPSLSNFSHPNVQGTLELIAGFAASAGSGFVSIGDVSEDGYATGSYNVGSSTTPTFRDALIAAFADDRLQNGGIIFVLSGIYKLSTTVEVPAGITLMGEDSGSIIVGEMTDQPMFLLKRGSDHPRIGGDSGGGDLQATVGVPVDEIRLKNLLLFDNLDGYLSGGATMTTVPMVQIEQSARVHLEHIRFIGRIDDGAVSGRNKTAYAVATTAGGSSGTYLSVKNCFIDAVGVGIKFTPGSGNNDHLSIKNTRARTFGTEDNTATATSDNCFVDMSLCNLLAHDNYHVGYGSSPNQFVNACFVISATGSGSSDVDILVTGTGGGPSGGFETSKAVLYDETGSIDIKSFVGSNNWGSEVDNRWFVTVGQGNSTTGGFGDFMGSGAIDLLLSTDYGYPTTVIVNPGTYTVTSSGSANYNFIGNVSDNSLPIFDLNVTSGTDELGNRLFTCGNYLESIKFQSNSAGNFHSVRPGGSSTQEQVEVHNCFFIDATLSVDDAVASSERSVVRVTNSTFNQGAGGFADNASLLLPLAGKVILQGCHVYGKGYAGLIGSDSGLAYGSSVTYGTINISDCSFDQSDTAITGASPFASNGYLIISDTAASLNIENTSVVANNNLGSITTTIDASLRSSGFDRYIYLNTKDLYINNSLFHAPNVTYKSGGTDYPLYNVKIEPTRSCKVYNSKFIYGGLPCQIGGTTDSMANASAESIEVIGSMFLLPSSVICNSVFDIDLDPSITTNNPNILLSKNKFNVGSLGEANNAPQHSASGSSYDAVGIVQIYVDDLQVIVSDNFIEGRLASTAPSGVNHLSGLVIDTTRPTSAGLVTPTHVTNNQIRIINTFASASATQSASTAFIKGTSLLVENNYLNNTNLATPSASTITCLYIENNQVNSVDPEDATVIGNIISNRRSSNNTSTTLVNGFIRIPGTSSEGVITNNTFSDTTFDGFDEALVSDDSSSWTSFNNVNEIVTITTRGELGNIGLAEGGTEGYLNLAMGGSGIGANISSAVQIDPTDVTNPVLFGYQDIGSAVHFKWSIPLQGLVPNGAIITEVKVAVNVLSTPDTTNTSRLRVIASSTSTDSTSITTSGHTHSLTGLSQRVISGNYSYIELYAQLNDTASNINYTAGPMTIKYHI